MRSTEEIINPALEGIELGGNVLRIAAMPIPNSLGHPIHAECGDNHGSVKEPGRTTTAVAPIHVLQGKEADVFKRRQEGAETLLGHAGFLMTIYGYTPGAVVLYEP